MKQYAYRFENILTFQEQKKLDSENDYKHSIEEFERVATELYDLLKKKEDLLAEQEEKLKYGFSVESLQYYARYLTRLEEEIALSQKKVIEYRAKMNWFEEKLLEDTIEVRKYEKMKEHDQQLYKEEMEHLEAIQLDELSTQQFSRKESRW